MALPGDNGQYFLHVFPHFPFGLGYFFFFFFMQDIGRVVGGNERDIIETEQLAADAAHAVAGFQEVVQGDFAKADDNFGTEKFNLAAQIGQAGFGFFLQRLTVIGRPAFHYIADEYVFAVATHFLDYFIQQLPGIANEWAAELVFGLTRAFANENDIRVIGAFANDVVGLAFMEPALLALQDGTVQLGHVGARIAFGQMQKLSAHFSVKFQYFL